MTEQVLEATPAPVGEPQQPGGFLPGSVVIGLVDGGGWSAAFGLSLLELQAFDVFQSHRVVQPGCGVIRDRASTMGVASARNSIVRRFLADTPGEWLLFIDSDMGFEPTLVEELLCDADPAERPIVGGLTFSQRHDVATEGACHAQRFLIRPVMYDWIELDDDPAAGQQAEAGFIARMEYARESVVQVGGTGAACLLIHRSVLEAIRERYGAQWFALITHPHADTDGGPRSFSEDLSFCVRAQSLGYPIHVDTRVKTTHDKGGVFLDEETFQAQQMLAGLTGALQQRTLSLKGGDDGDQDAAA